MRRRPRRWATRFWCSGVEARRRGRLGARQHTGEDQPEEAGEAHDTRRIQRGQGRILLGRIGGESRAITPPAEQVDDAGQRDQDELQHPLPRAQGQRRNDDAGQQEQGDPGRLAQGLDADQRIDDADDRQHDPSSQGRPPRDRGDQAEQGRREQRQQGWPEIPAHQ